MRTQDRQSKKKTKKPLTHIHPQKERKRNNKKKKVFNGNNSDKQEMERFIDI